MCVGDNKSVGVALRTDTVNPQVCAPPLCAIPIVRIFFCSSFPVTRYCDFNSICAHVFSTPYIKN